MLEGDYFLGGDAVTLRAAVFCFFALDIEVSKSIFFTAFLNKVCVKLCLKLAILP